MQVDKQSVIDMIRRKAGDQRADQAAQELPDKIDSEQHLGLLQRYGVDPESLPSKFGGASDAGGTTLGDDKQDLETRVGGSDEAGGTRLGPRPS